MDEDEIEAWWASREAENDVPDERTEFWLKVHDATRRQRIAQGLCSVCGERECECQEEE